MPILLLRILLHEFIKISSVYKLILFRLGQMRARELCIDTCSRINAVDDNEWTQRDILLRMCECDCTDPIVAMLHFEARGVTESVWSLLVELAQPNHGGWGWGNSTMPKMIFMSFLATFIFGTVELAPPPLQLSWANFTKFSNCSKIQK